MESLCKNILLVFSILILLTSCNAGVDISSQQSEGLFSSAVGSGMLPTKDDPTIMRTSYVEVDLELLKNAEVGDEIILNLFEDAVYPFVLDKKTKNNDGSTSIAGHIKDVEHSNVAIVLGAGQAAGNIVLPQEIYQIRYAGENIHAVHQIDQSAFPPEAEPIITD